jgi:hypothetical protein
VTLTIKAPVNAQVYLNNVERGTIQPDGTLIIPDLTPRAYQMRLSLEGYQTVEKTLELSLTNRRPVEKIELVPIPESGEVSENFTTGVTKWIIPTNWKLDQRGLRISGDQPGLFKGTFEQRQYNYRDFDLDFDIRFINGRGAAWIVRAKDSENYYLFELTTANNPSRKRLFNFYLCRNGKCELKDSLNVVETLERPDDSYHIRLEARGRRFVHKISILKAPRPDDPQPLGTFEDDTFSIGGIGFRSVNGSETLLQSLVITPQK